MPLAWVPLWLVMHLAAEACRKGILPPTKGTRGTAEICHKGNMTANAGPAVRCGTNVILSCQLRDGHATGWCRLGIFFNGSERGRSYGRSVDWTFPVSTYGRHTFTCKTTCAQRKTLICGIDIESGKPPDEPRNVSCIQTGRDGHPVCTWDKGTPTYINTTYVLQLSNGTHNLCFSEGRPKEIFGSLALSRLNFDSNYTVVVSASNDLGNASSQPLTFMLIDIVKPHPPDFFVECDSSSATNCTFSWHNKAQAQHYRLRYRPLTRHSWSTVESLRGERHHLRGLEPDTAYEFQLSCKLHPERGLWSDWSTSQTRTPAAEPTGTLDVWYRQQDVGPQQQNISLFWKALSKAEAGGRILGYTVTFEALDHQNLSRECHHTTQTSYSRLAARGRYRITVTARNSRGRSPPASILTHPGTQDLPPPQQVSVVASKNSSIVVSWEPPARWAVPLRGYVVEWAETRRDPQLEPQHGWAELPTANLSAVIAEHVKDDTCYQIQVFALYQDRAGQAASVRGCSTSQAVPDGTAPDLLHIPDLQPAEEGWVTLVLTCSFFIFSACVCSLPPARKVLCSLLPQWHSKAIPDPANAAWAKSFEAAKAELSSPSSPFLPSTAAFEEPEPAAVEEAPPPPEPPDKARVGSAGSGGHGPWAREEPQLPELYQRLVLEAEEPPQPVPEYIGPAEPPPDSAGQRPEPHPLPLLPPTFVPAALCCPGNIALDGVKLGCSPFPR